MRQAAAERCTRAVAAPAPALNDERTLVESESELEALTRPTTCPSHGVHGLPPLAPARTHARGVTEYPARREWWWCVRGAPEEGDCRRCWWGRGRGGGARNGAVCGGGLGAGARAAGGGCRSLGKLVAWRQMGSLNADTARADAALSARGTHGWCVST